MLVTPIQPAGPVPAEEFFPSWRGREPYAERLKEIREALLGAHPEFADAVAALPFERFESACHVVAPVHKYNEVPAGAAAMVAALAGELRAPWLCALMLWHIERFDQTFAASGLPDEFALHYADSFNRILDQIEKDFGLRRSRQGQLSQGSLARRGS